MLGFTIGFVLFIGALVWLYRSKQGDVRACGALLGLEPVPENTERRGTTPEGFDGFDVLRLRGTLEHMPAEIWERKIRRPLDPKLRRQRGTYFTVLALTPGRPAARPFRLQPVGMLRGLERLMKEAPAVVRTGDAAFDAAYRLYADDATGAMATLTADLRRDILTFRRAVAGDLPANTAGDLSSGLLLGTFEIGPERASYWVFGTPSGKIGGHMKQAAPLLARLAGPR